MTQMLLNMIRSSNIQWLLLLFWLSLVLMLVSSCGKHTHSLNYERTVYGQDTISIHVESRPVKSVSVLLNELKDADALVRERAAGELGNVLNSSDSTIHALVALFNDPDPYVQGKACRSLGNLGSVCVPSLITALSDTSVNMRWCAAISLGKIGRNASAAVNSLSILLNDPHENIRWGCLMSLAQIGPDAREAVRDIKKCRYDRDEDVRWASGFALNEIDPVSQNIRPELRQVITFLDSLTPCLMNELHVPGVSIALVSSCSLAWSRAFGITDVRTGALVTHESIFEAASMSKPVFAYSFLKLAENGAINLDEPLVVYYAEPAVPTQDERKLITGRMVLSHTSGLPNWRKGEEERDGPLPVFFMPGSRFNYSGEGIFSLQGVMEQLVNEPLDAFARRTLFTPLDMKNTDFAWSEKLDLQLAAGHDEKGNFLEKTKYRHPNAAYTLYTTAEDYARFMIEIMKSDRSEHHSLSRASIKKMLSHEISTTVRSPIERPGQARGREVWWGLGWSINTTLDGDIIHHSGSNRSGFRSFAQFNPNRQSGIVIMTNGSAGSDLWIRLISAIGDF
jgi:CubicO group peptidase (beta-lactamase class C family)